MTGNDRGERGGIGTEDVQSVHSYSPLHHADVSVSLRRHLSASFLQLSVILATWSKSELCRFHRARTIVFEVDP